MRLLTYLEAELAITMSLLFTALKSNRSARSGGRISIGNHQRVHWPASLGSEKVVLRHRAGVQEWRRGYRYKHTTLGRLVEGVAVLKI